MKLSSIVTVALVGAVAAAPAGPPDPPRPPHHPAHPGPGQSSLQSDALTAKGNKQLDAYLAKKGYPSPAKCNKKNVAVRKEWSALSTPEKKDYIKAVQCMSKLPAKTPAGIAAGAKNRYDDFVATHINQTLFIHGTVRNSHRSSQ